MTETTVGREPVQIVEIVQPLCANTFSISPCTASAATGGECFNTRSTCQDPENYDGSSTLSLLFGHGNLADRDISGAPYVIPSLVSVSTIPSRINLASTDRDSSGLGQRASVTAVFEDHPGSDKRVDPYVSTRTYNPLERGSWWTKWLARNLYRYNIEMNVYEGYIGQALGSMQKRSYVITDVTGPGEDGRVNIKAKDFLSVVEERKAQVPRAQGGKLFRDTSASQDRLSVIGAAASDYSAAGWIQIDDEIIRYSSITSGAQGTIVFRVQTRGAFESTAAAHDAETKVQEVGVYNNLGVDTVVEDLLTSFAA